MNIQTGTIAVYEPARPDLINPPNRLDKGEVVRVRTVNGYLATVETIDGKIRRTIHAESLIVR